MSDERRQAIIAYRKAKIHVLDLIKYYTEHHKPVYTSFEKNCFYDWGLNTAYDEVYRSHDAPLAALDRLLAKFDTYAHSDGGDTERFRIVVAAIDDLIDLVTNN